MAKTKITDFGSRVCVGSERNEHTVPALGDGTFGKPGNLCAIDPATGRIVGADVGALEQFIGILKESPITGSETVVVQDVPCALIEPKSGHRYRIRIDDVGATLKSGHSVKFGANAGFAIKTTNLLDPGVIGRINLEALTGDTVVEVTWK